MKKKERLKNSNNMNFDCWGCIVSFFEKPSDFASLCLCVKGFYHYISVTCPSFCSNILFIPNLKVVVPSKLDRNRCGGRFQGTKEVESSDIIQGLKNEGYSRKFMTEPKVAICLPQNPKHFVRRLKIMVQINSRKCEYVIGKIIEAFPFLEHLENKRIQGVGYRSQLNYLEAVHIIGRNNYEQTMFKEKEKKKGEEDVVNSWSSNYQPIPVQIKSTSKHLKSLEFHVSRFIDLSIPSLEHLSLHFSTSRSFKYKVPLSFVGEEKHYFSRLRSLSIENPGNIENFFSQVIMKSNDLCTNLEHLSLVTLRVLHTSRSDLPSMFAKRRKSSRGRRSLLEVSDFNITFLDPNHDPLKPWLYRNNNSSSSSSSMQNQKKEEDDEEKEGKNEQPLKIKLKNLRSIELVDTKTDPKRDDSFSNLSFELPSLISIRTAYFNPEFWRKNYPFGKLVNLELSFCKSWTMGEVEERVNFLLTCNESSLQHVRLEYHRSIVREVNLKFRNIKNLRTVFVLTNVNAWSGYLGVENDDGGLNGGPGIDLYKENRLTFRNCEKLNEIRCSSVDCLELENTPSLSSLHLSRNEQFKIFLVIGSTTHTKPPEPKHLLFFSLKKLVLRDLRFRHENNNYFNSSNLMISHDENNDTMSILVESSRNSLEELVVVDDQETSQFFSFLLSSLEDRKLKSEGEIFSHFPYLKSLFFLISRGRESRNMSFFFSSNNYFLTPISISGMKYLRNLKAVVSKGTVRLRKVSELPELENLIVSRHDSELYLFRINNCPKLKSIRFVFTGHQSDIDNGDDNAESSQSNTSVDKPSNVEFKNLPSLQNMKFGMFCDDENYMLNRIGFGRVLEASGMEERKKDFEVFRVQKVDFEEICKQIRDDSDPGYSFHIGRMSRKLVMTSDFEK